MTGGTLFNVVKLDSPYGALNIELTVYRNVGFDMIWISSIRS